MAMYFLDSSAVVKRYIPEQGHKWIDALCDAAQGHEIYIAQSALVEVVAALCRREREGSITLAEREAKSLAGKASLILFICLSRWSSWR